MISVARSGAAPSASGGNSTCRRASTSAAVGQLVALSTTTRLAASCAASASSAGSITERASGRLGERAVREPAQGLLQIGARARDVAQPGAARAPPVERALDDARGHARQREDGPEIVDRAAELAAPSPQLAAQDAQLGPARQTLEGERLEALQRLRASPEREERVDAGRLGLGREGSRREAALVLIER